MDKLATSKVISTLLFLAIATTDLNAQSPVTGRVEGRVVDTVGALMQGVEVSITDSKGSEIRTTTDQNGMFSITNLKPGRYSLKVTNSGFVAYENSEIEVEPSKPVSLKITLTILPINEQVSVGEEQRIGTDPESNAGAIVLKKQDIEALPTDPAELSAALQALAGPSAGPSGGEIFVDGFSGSKLPRRDSIKEIRINQNPFSSEFSRMGLGRIEIITKPGTNEWTGEFGSQFEDESLNSRNPFASNRPPFQVRSFEGNLSGPIVKKKISFFLDAEHQSEDVNALINARVLDPTLNTVSLQQAILTPSLGIEINPRVDLQINQKNTLTARYGFSRDTEDNAGLGGFDLLSRIYKSIDHEHFIRLTENTILKTSVVNETRFQFAKIDSTQNAANNLPTIVVNEAFTSGGANIGKSSNNETRIEVSNNTSFTINRHVLKVGILFRRVSLTNVAQNNFAGTFTFTSIDQYRNTLLSLQGALPAQFSIAGGNPKAKLTLTDYAAFAQNDWRLKPSLAFSFGMRYENQTGISDYTDFAPRFAFAYAPGAGTQKTPKTVFRGGVGIFYERFGRSLLLQSERFNGVNQQQYIVTDPVILDAVIFSSSGVSNVPSVQALSSFAQPQTTRVIAPTLRVPRYFQTAFGIERQIPHKTTLSATYVYTRISRQLRSRNINAPVNGIRPLSNAGNIFEYESTGRYNQNQFVINFRSNFNEHASFFGNYSLGTAKSDTEGAGYFPSNSYDLSNEYGDSLQDIRHRFTFGGSYNAPFGIRFSPFINYRTGIPFNITTGVDANGDTIFNERPSFASSLSEPGIIITKFGTFDPTPELSDTLIPRNFGRGSSFLGVNLSTAKDFGLGRKKSGSDDAAYNLELSLQVRNLFNHTNRATPIGNLRSSVFGEATSLAGGFGGGGGTSSAGNRRLILGVKFGF